MFLYLSMQAPHTPLQAPQEYVDMYSDIEDTNRRVYSAMVTAMDDAIKNVVESLKLNDMYDNTVIAFVSGEFMYKKFDSCTVDNIIFIF